MVMFLLQIAPIRSADSALTSLENASEVLAKSAGFLNVLLLVAIILSVVALIFLSRYFIINFFKHNRAFKRKLYLIKVPKERKTDSASSQGQEDAAEKTGGRE